MYNSGQYSFRVPPVGTSRWSDSDWIAYIDGPSGEWQPDYECDDIAELSGEDYHDLKWDVHSLLDIMPISGIVDHFKGVFSPKVIRQLDACCKKERA